MWQNSWRTAELTRGDLLQFATSLNTWYVPCTVLSVTLSQAVGLSSSIVPWVKNLLSYSAISSLYSWAWHLMYQRTVWFRQNTLHCLEGLICLKYFRSAFIPETHLHDNVIDFKKIFLKMFDYFQNFQKLNLLKISRYTVSYTMTRFVKTQHSYIHMQYNAIIKHSVKTNFTWKLTFIV